MEIKVANVFQLKELTKEQIQKRITMTLNAGCYCGLTLGVAPLKKDGNVWCSLESKLSK